MIVDDLLKRLYVHVQEGYIHYLGLMKQQIHTTESCTLYELACKEKLWSCCSDWSQLIYRKKYRLPIFLNKKMDDLRMDYSLDPTKPFGTMPRIRNDGRTYLIKQFLLEVEDDLLMPYTYYRCLSSTFVDDTMSSVGYSYIPFINISIGFKLDSMNHDFYMLKELSNADIQNILSEDYRIADVGQFKYIDGKITIS